MFAKGTTEREIYDKAYLDGWSGKEIESPYAKPELDSAWNMGYTSGLNDRKLLHEE